MELVFATHNLDKLKEVQALIPASITLLSLKDIGCEEDIPETSPTIEGNALQKATYVKDKYDYPCFADDTGLEVDALFGEPGVSSARYAGEQKNAEDNMKKLLTELKDKTKRTAQFKTVIALVTESDQHLFTGICKGQITKAKQGDKGFGYDPIFQPDGYPVTFAEMSLADKNKIGHRGKAVKELVDYLNKKE